MPNIMIQVPLTWGGLGDNLAFSTLPELFADTDVDVYLSSKCMVRNNGITDLVWKPNPYLKGVIDPAEFTMSMANEKGLVLAHGFEFDFDEQYKTGWNGTIINKWEEIASTIMLQKPMRSVSGLPAVYYKACESSKVDGDYIVLDFSAVSTQGDYNYEAYWKVVQQRHNGERILIPKFRDKHGKITSPTPEKHGVMLPYEFVELSNIFDYVDLLAHAKKFYTVYAGMNTLAPVYQKDITTFMPNRYNLGGPCCKMIGDKISGRARLMKEYTCEFMFPNVEYYAWWEHK
jgi:hypothetical protein